MKVEDSESPIKPTTKRKKRVLSESEGEEENQQVNDSNSEAKLKIRKTEDNILEEEPVIKINDENFEISRENLKETAKIANEMNKVSDIDTKKSENQKVRNIDESLKNEEKGKEKKESVKKTRVKKEKPKEETELIKSTRKSKKTLNNDSSENEEVESKNTSKNDLSEDENEKTKSKSTQKSAKRPKKTNKKESSDEDNETKTKPASKIHPFFGAGAKDAKVQETKEPNTKRDLYNPALSKYHPIDDAMWKKGEKVPYLALARTFELIEDTSARLDLLKGQYKMVHVVSLFLV